MWEFVLLDSGPLSHACRRRGTPLADQCRLWLDGLVARGVVIVVPEIADYEVRQRGVPTAAAHALDADVILAACATTVGQAGDQVIVATLKVGHLARYCDARLWTSIV